MTRTKDGLARVRAWWFRRQGLAARTPPQTMGDALRLTGWVTTSGSTNVYLSIRARMRGMSRDAVDRAILDGTEVRPRQLGDFKRSAVDPADRRAKRLAFCNMIRGT